MTLGPGSWGGSITSDNITPLHLINIKRLGEEIRPYRDPLRDTSKRPATGLRPAMAADAASPLAAPDVDRIVREFLADLRANRA